MRAKARLLGHPIHPMLIGFPLGLLTPIPTRQRIGCVEIRAEIDADIQPVNQFTA